MLLIDKMNEIEEFNTICRLCLNQVQSSNQFVMISRCFIEKDPLKTVIELCGQIEIGDDDKLPKKVCFNCLGTVYRSYSFMKQCKISDQKLHDLLEASNKQQQEKCLDQIITVKAVEEINSQLLEPFEATLEEIIKKNDNIEDKIENNSNNIEIKDEKITDEYDISSNYEVKESEQEESSVDDISNDKSNEIQVKEEEEFFPAGSNQQKKKKAPMKKYICEYCGLIFKKRCLTIHLRVHTKERPFVCKICSFSFSITANLQRHMLLHTGERPYMCDICGKSFVQSGTLRTHRSCHSEEKAFSCPYCDKKFKSRPLQRGHVKRIHEFTLKEPKNLHTESEKKDIKKSSEMLKFLCSICGKGFKVNTQLQVHLRIHTREKPYTCNYCNKSFSAQNSWRAHNFIHTGEKPYICKICGKGFKQAPHLKHHLQWHSGEKPYKCSYCGKGFTSNRTRSVHVKKHTGDAQYKCTFCEKCFYDDRSLRKHKRIHERENDVK